MANVRACACTLFNTGTLPHKRAVRHGSASLGCSSGQVLRLTHALARSATKAQRAQCCGVGASSRRLGLPRHCPGEPEPPTEKPPRPQSMSCPLTDMTLWPYLPPFWPALHTAPSDRPVHQENMTSLGRGPQSTEQAAPPPPPPRIPLTQGKYLPGARPACYFSINYPDFSPRLTLSWRSPPQVDHGGLHTFPTMHFA